MTPPTPLTGAITLTGHQYGKAENHVVRIVRDTPRHEIRDVTVSSGLRGDFADAYLTGDQSAVLPTDTQKQTIYSYAKEKGIGSVEDYALALARHFVDDVAPVGEARIEVREDAWDRVVVDGAGHDHTWTRRGQETRVTAATVRGTGAAQQVWVVSGFVGLVLLKSTGSEFHGFLRDSYTVLEETDDRVMATSLDARWRLTDGVVEGTDWEATYASVRALLCARFATLQSKALQQTLFAMATAVLEAHPEIAEVRLQAPNRHHFDYDLARFGVENAGEVFHADDRPYGLIHATVARSDAPDAGPAWDDGAGQA